MNIEWPRQPVCFHSGLDLYCLWVQTKFGAQKNLPLFYPGQVFDCVVYSDLLNSW